MLAAVAAGVRSRTGVVPVRVATWLRPARLATARLGLVLLRRIRHCQTFPEKSQILHPALRVLHHLVRHGLLQFCRFGYQLGVGVVTVRRPICCGFGNGVFNSLQFLNQSNFKSPSWYEFCT